MIRLRKALKIISVIGAKHERSCIGAGKEDGMVNNTFKDFETDTLYIVRNFESISELREKEEDFYKEYGAKLYQAVSYLVRPYYRNYNPLGFEYEDAVIEGCAHILRKLFLLIPKDCEMVIPSIRVALKHLMIDCAKSNKYWDENATSLEEECFPDDKGSVALKDMIPDENADFERSLNNKAELSEAMEQIFSLDSNFKILSVAGIVIDGFKPQALSELIERDGIEAAYDTVLSIIKDICPFLDEMINEKLNEGFGKNSEYYDAIPENKMCKLLTSTASRAIKKIRGSQKERTL